MPTLDILVILDRSGSMQDARSDHEGGLRSFVEDQRRTAGDVRFTLIQFDTVNPCEVIYDRTPIADVKEIVLVPRGGTPLLDAMGRALDHLSRPDVTEVVAMVITDGEENTSHEWTKERIAARVKDLEGKSWTFLFLGANIDAFAAAGGIGVAAMHTMSFNQNDAAPVAAMYSSLTSNVQGYRIGRSAGLAPRVASAKSLGFSAPQRVGAMGGPARKPMMKRHAPGTTGGDLNELPEVDVTDLRSQVTTSITVNDDNDDGA